MPYRARVRSHLVKRLPAALILLAALTFVGLAPAQGAPTVEDARTAISEAPEDPRAWVSLGHAWLAEDDPRLARDAFARALSYDSTLCDAHDGVGLSSYRLDDPETALAAFGEVVRLCPNRFDGHFNQAVTLARLGQPEEASEAFARALDEAAPEASNGERAEAWQGIASQAALLGRYDEAAVAYRAARQLAPRVASLLLLEAEAWLLAGQPREALDDLTSYASQTGDPEARLLLARLHRALGEDDRARGVLEAALRQARPEDSEVHASLAWQLVEVAQALGDDAGARRALETVLIVTPNDFAALYRLGSLELEQGNLAAAREALSQARNLAPMEPEIRIALALLHDREGDDRAALEEARGAIELLDTQRDGAERQVDEAGTRRLYTDAYALAARGAYGLADYSEVERMALAWLERLPDAHEAWTWLGLQAYQLERYEEAIAAFETTLRHAPESLAVRVNLASALLAAKRFGEAGSAYEGLIAAVPEDGSYPYYYGWALLGEERSDEARQAWVSACNLGYRKACEDLADTF